MVLTGDSFPVTSFYKTSARNKITVMFNQSILASIQDAVYQINDLTQLQKEKAAKICKGVFNQLTILTIGSSSNLPATFFIQ